MANTTSIWGWGEADRFPEAEHRSAMGQWASALLGFSTGAPREPVPAEALELRPSRVSPPTALQSLCSTTVRDRAAHSYGKAYPDLVRGFRGEYPHPPDVVARPESEEDVAALLDWCGESGLALVPFGGGTSVVGGVEPPSDHGGVVTVDLKGLDRVLEVDPISRAARIQGGALGPVLNAQLAEHDFELRCFPQSYRYSTLGGWIVTRAGGHYATVRTHVDDLVESVRMVTPQGVWESRRLPGSGAGPSPDRMILGSEGTLGIVTEAWMRVVRPPRFRASATVFYSTWEQAVAGLRAVSQAGLAPTNCRLLDATEARINAVSADPKATLILGFESDDHELGPWIRRAVQLAVAAGGVCPKGARTRDAKGGGGGAASSWRDAFFEGPYLRDVLVSLGTIVDTFETACTWDRFPELDAAVRSAVQDALNRVCGGGTVSCRVTHVYPDGLAPYYTFLGPGREGAELEQWAEVKQAASDALLAAGGTITHHHAVGRMHRDHYAEQQPGPFGHALRAVKQAIDPAGTLNPGVLIPPSHGEQV
ncbi:MAG: FAD-binding oxidoreductase [Deltaproteobacteria bacterium]|nr:FAD-binding oxidoreductase [Deltaproteobacteria bacterium]